MGAGIPIVYEPTTQFISIFTTSGECAYGDGEINMNEFDEFPEDTSDDNDGLDPNIRAELRKSKEYRKQAAAAEAERDAALRDLAFMKAGIPDTGAGALLRKSWDGENDPEAIRKAAEEYEIFKPSEGSAKPDPVLDELERHRSIAGATGTNESGPASDQELSAALANATSQDEVMSIINSMGGESGLFAPGMR